MRDGAMANAQLTNYIIPTTLDTPAIDVVMLENPYAGGPFGAKGVGEMPIDGPAPAVVNAIRHLGHRRARDSGDAGDDQGGRMRFTLNAARRSTSTSHPMTRLLDVLREDCGLTGTKEGAAKASAAPARCWSTARPVCSCLVPFAQVEGAEVTTIEGLGDGASAAARVHGRGGRAVRHLHAGHDPGRRHAGLPADASTKIREGLAGNLCRCTGYEAIYRAIQQRRRENRHLPLWSCSSRARCSDALRMLRDDGPLTPLAGATDLYVALQLRHADERRASSTSGRCDPLRRITLRDDTLRIGALATYTALIRSRLVRRRLPMLASAAREVGGVQIQNRGTLGGNVANGSPAGDTLPVLAAAEAVVVLRSADGERRVPFGEFYTGYRDQRPPAGRADRGLRDPAGRGPAVVPQGRHAGGAGDLEGGHGGRAGPASADRARQRGADGHPTLRRRASARRGAEHRRRRSACWTRTSARSTTCDRPRPTGGTSRPICSAGSGRRPSQPTER